LANLGKSQSANIGLLSSLVSMAGISNNNGNILNTLGGLESGFGGFDSIFLDKLSRILESIIFN